MVAEIRKHVEKRQKEVSPQSVNRELKIIAATLNSAKTYYRQLSEWVPPKMPRLKKSNARRERLFTAAEKFALLGELMAPQREDEHSMSAIARRRVGLKWQFACLTGMRHGEMNGIQKEDVDFEGKRLKVMGVKTQYASNPTWYIKLTDTMIAIIREFYTTQPDHRTFE
jgi:integrase